MFRWVDLHIPFSKLVNPRTPTFANPRLIEAGQLPLPSLISATRDKKTMIKVITRIWAINLLLMRLFSVFDAYMQPGSDWRDVLISSGHVGWLLSLYSELRKKFPCEGYWLDCPIAVSARKLIVQFCSLTGTVFVSGMTVSLSPFMIFKLINVLPVFLMRYYMVILNDGLYRGFWVAVLIDHP